MGAIQYQSPIGTLCIREENGAIVQLYLEQNSEINKVCKDEIEIPIETEVLKKARIELDEYFDGKRTTFDLPIRLSGTVFQMQVWKALQEIPYGTTCSYGEIAKKIGNPKACRAVGGANNKNQILIVVPCHRVIGTDGKLVGFGAGLMAKQYLLELERQHK